MLASPGAGTAQTQTYKYEAIKTIRVTPHDERRRLGLVN